MDRDPLDELLDGSAPRVRRAEQPDLRAALGAEVR